MMSRSKISRKARFVEHVEERFGKMSLDVKGGPEPSKKIIQKVLSPIGRFHF